MDLKNKKILVTGAGGFIGSHLVERLIQEGYQVTALYRKIRKNAKLENRFKKVIGNVTDYNSIKVIVENCHTIIHLAALNVADNSIENLERYQKINVHGTNNILKAAQETGNKRTLITSSASVYAPSSKLINEKGRIEISNNYARTKRENELNALEAHKSGLPTTIVRLFNTYGEKQSTKAIIPKIITQLLMGKEININQNARISFVYVKDVVDAYIKILQNNKSNGRVINIGSKESIDLSSLVSEIEDLRGISGKVNYIKGPLVFRGCNNNFANNLLGWHPTTPFKVGLEKTINYVKEHLEEYKRELK